MTYHKTVGPRASWYPTQTSVDSRVPVERGAAVRRHQPLPAAYWTQLAQGPGRSDVSSSAQRAQSAQSAQRNWSERIRVAPTQPHVGAGHADERVHNLPLNHYISPNEQTILTWAMNEVVATQVGSLTLQLLDEAPKQRKLVLTVGEVFPIRKADSVLFNRIEGDDSSELVLMLDRGIVRDAALIDLLQVLQRGLIQASAVAGQRWGDKTIAYEQTHINFQHNLVMNRANDMFLSELRVQSDAELQYVIHLRQRLIRDNQWVNHKQQVLEVVSPQLLPALTEVNYLGHSLTLAEAIDRLEEFRAIDMPTEADLEGMTALMSAVRTLVAQKQVSAADVEQLLKRPHLINPMAREVIKLDVLLGLAADEPRSERPPARWVDDEAI